MNMQSSYMSGATGKALPFVLNAVSREHGGRERGSGQRDATHASMWPMPYLPFANATQAARWSSTARTTTRRALVARRQRL